MAFSVVPRGEYPVLCLQCLQLAGVRWGDDRVAEEQIFAGETQNPGIAKHLFTVETSVEEDARHRRLAAGEEDVTFLEETGHMELSGFKGLSHEVARVIRFEDVPSSL
ncbi:ATP-dependent DNA helicase, putative [Babesia ovata]|uniref:ATP-dependent DNA helicase, putative n=1 Tax=Babesia ovata TaxID=189622 RepID=A0A2H6KD92_9APIC|nr:ATP-dependent DNA helicase, putative [Babesia ovata]GBE60955.1 ATP-dependent DNA helicase, putative [Babesia ovata]